MSDPIYQNSYMAISMPLVESDGTTPIDANNFAEAEFLIYETGTCTAIYQASLGGDISVVGTDLLLEIPENTVDVYGTDGEYTRVLRAAYNPGELGAPYFSETVNIIKTCAVA